MTLSNEARRHLDRYLDDIRASMGGDVGEIEQDIRDHVDAELGDRSTPVTAAEIEAVLTRLGHPTEWATEAPRAPQESRAESWLGYTALVLLPFLFPVSWLLARWALARLEQRGEPVGARRWILYPPLAVVSVVLVLFALFWPFGAAAEIGTMAAQRLGAESAGRMPPMTAIAVAFGCLGVYWILLGVAAALGERAVRFLFHPFAEGFGRRHGWWLSGIGAIVAAVCALLATFH